MSPGALDIGEWVQSWVGPRSNRPRFVEVWDLTDKVTQLMNDRPDGSCIFSNKWVLKMERRTNPETGSK